MPDTTTLLFDEIKLDPAQAFARPEDILTQSHFTTEQKIELLQRWRYDVLDLDVAEEENMQRTGNGRDLLPRILAALHSLGATLHLDETPPTKQGGE